MTVTRYLAMNRRITTALLLIGIWTASLAESSFAQDATVSGRVTDAESGESLPGVNVQLQDILTGTITDLEGNYELSVPPEADTLVFSYIGYRAQEVEIGGRTQIDVALEPQVMDIGELVVVGVGTQRRQDLTGAVSTVNVDEVLESRPITDVARGLQGTVPGLTITTPTGDLGTDPAITLRGAVGSLNTGSDGARPLILVDNVEIESLQMINPQDIASISVLKDAAATSIYGTRAAWGVILITTKSGRMGAQNRITYSTNMSYSTPLQKFELMNASDQIRTSLAAVRRFAPDQESYKLIGVTYDDYARERIEEWETLYGDQELSDEMVLGRDFEVRDGQLYFFRPWDAADIMISDWAPQQTHNINISGGSERASYNVGLGLLNQAGVLKVNDDEFTRYNVSVGLNTVITDWLHVRSNILFSQTDLRDPYVFQSESFNNWYYLYRWTTVMPYGTYQGLPFHNAITQAEQAHLNEDRNTLGRASIASTVTLMDGLTVDGQVTYSSRQRNLVERGGGIYAWEFWGFNGGETPGRYENYIPDSHDRINYLSGWNRNSTGRAYATYVDNIQDHSIQLIAGGDVEVDRFTEHASERRDLLDPDKTEINLATGDEYVDGSADHWSTLGAFSRINYSYRDRYLLQLNARFDGSSRFPTDQHWGFFPSIAAGYVLTEEPLLGLTDSFIDFLKIRASYGSVGNQNVGTNRFLATMNSNSSGWLLPTGIARSMSTPGALSPILTWETVTTENVGIDARFLDHRLSVAFDLYRRTTSDMITSGIILPESYGAAPPVRNFGELTGTGWELMVGFNHRLQNGIGLSVTGSLSDGREKITRFSSATREIDEIYEGRYLGDIWGFETDRLFQESDFTGVDPETGRYIYADGVPSQAENESDGFITGPGDVKYVDLNDDGIIGFGDGTVDNPGDRRIIGNSTPRYQYGLRLGADWRGFDVSTFIQGVGKRDFWGGGKLVQPGEDNSLFGAAWFDYQIDYWTPENTDAFYSRPTNNSDWNYRIQSRYLLDMSYLRVKNITFGYTFYGPNVLQMQSLRLYVSGENLFTRHNLGPIPIDPETGQVNNTLGASYPYRRTYSVGLEVGF